MNNQQENLSQQLLFPEKIEMHDAWIAIKIAKNGIKEVVITGIHIASYGKDFKEEYRLIDLLEEINKAVEKLTETKTALKVIVDEMFQEILYGILFLL